MTMTDEELATWYETANDGEGPTPVATVHRADIDALEAALRERDAAEANLAEAVTAAHDRGASWAVIGNTLGLTRQGAHRRYARQTV